MLRLLHILDSILGSKLNKGKFCGRCISFYHRKTDKCSIFLFRKNEERQICHNNFLQGLLIDCKRNWRLLVGCCFEWKKFVLFTWACISHGSFLSPWADPFSPAVRKCSCSSQGWEVPGTVPWHCGLFWLMFPWSDSPTFQLHPHLLLSSLPSFLIHHICCQQALLEWRQDQLLLFPWLPIIEICIVCLLIIKNKILCTC